MEKKNTSSQPKRGFGRQVALPSTFRSTVEGSAGLHKSLLASQVKSLTFNLKLLRQVRLSPSFRVSSLCLSSPTPQILSSSEQQWVREVPVSSLTFSSSSYLLSSHLTSSYVTPIQVLSVCLTVSSVFVTSPDSPIPPSLSPLSAVELKLSIIIIVSSFQILFLVVFFGADSKGVETLMQAMLLYLPCLCMTLSFLLLSLIYRSKRYIPFISCSPFWTYPRYT